MTKQVKKVREKTKAQQLRELFTTDMGGKMEGMASLGTAVTCNPFCQARIARGGDGICPHCYADTLLNMRKNLRAKLERAAAFLTAEIIPVDEMPFMNFYMFRFESFGDLINVNQAVNYLNLCYKNPHVNFALWTKNPGILRAAVKRVGKPENLVVVLSSEKVNEIAPRAEFWLASGLVDKVFTVWDSEEAAAAAGVVINCGSRKCANCQACYFKNGLVYIHELLKQKGGKRQN